MGAPKGNQNAKKNKDWESAIKRAIARQHGNLESGLDHLASKLIEAIENGEGWAIKEIGDRIDGKPAQSVIGDPENPIHVAIGKIKLVKPDD